MAKPAEIPQWELIDLHIHLGGAVAPHIMWSIAHDQGLKLPITDYWEFVEAITVQSERIHSLSDYLKIFHEWTDKIQSSPWAVERSVYEVISKEYRGSNVTAIELRFNPMKRNRGGAMDLDHIMHAAIRGMDKACLEYRVDAGLIICLDRGFDPEINEIILEKAIRYKDRGVVGLDLAGAEKHTMERSEKLLKNYADLFKRARDAGLKTTVHTGETQQTSGEGVIAAIQHLKPHRIGHGIRAAYNKEAMELLCQEDITLELCPTSNYLTKAVKDMDEFKHIVHTFLDAGVKITINTDGPYLLRAPLRHEFNLMLRHNILDEPQLKACLQTARETSFIPSVVAKAKEPVKVVERTKGFEIE